MEPMTSVLQIKSCLLINITGLNKGSFCWISYHRRSEDKLSLFPLHGAPRLFIDIVSLHHVGSNAKAILSTQIFTNLFSVFHGVLF